MPKGQLPSEFGFGTLGRIPWLEGLKLIRVRIALASAVAAVLACLGGCLDSDVTFYQEPMDKTAPPGQWYLRSCTDPNPKNVCSYFRMERSGNGRILVYDLDPAQRDQTRIELRFHPLAGGHLIGQSSSLNPAFKPASYALMRPEPSGYAVFDISLERINQDFVDQFVARKEVSKSVLRAGGMEFVTFKVITRAGLEGILGALTKVDNATLRKMTAYARVEHWSIVPEQEAKASLEERRAINARIDAEWEKYRPSWELMEAWTGVRSMASGQGGALPSSALPSKDDYYERMQEQSRRSMCSFYGGPLSKSAGASLYC